MKTKLISARVPVDMEEDLNDIAKQENVQKTVLIKKVMMIGLQKLKGDYALELYKQGKITLWKAAELAGISLWEIMDKVKEKKIPIKYDIEDARKDIKLVFR